MTRVVKQAIVFYPGTEFLAPFQEEGDILQLGSGPRTKAPREVPNEAGFTKGYIFPNGRYFGT